MILARIRHTVTAVATLIGVAIALPARADETLSFPSRASDLLDDSYWTVREFGEGCCTIDFNVMRWDSGWKRTSSNTNAGDFDWGLPLYAPASGEIISCWRNFPDDPSPGVDPPQPTFGGGNHVVILTDGGNAISMNHLQSGSILPGLCPTNSDTTAYPPSLDKEGNWRVHAYIPPGQRPRVTEGDRIGSVGASGDVSGPHLHMSMAPVVGVDSHGREAVGDEIPMRFRDVWGHRLEESQQDTPDGWFRYRGGELAGDPSCDHYQADSPECGFRMLHPSPYLRRADAAAGAVAKIDTAFLSSDRAVTAVVDDTGNLKLIAWDLVGLTTVTRRGDISAGTVKDVRVMTPVADYVVVAVREQDDDLKIIAYRVSAGGDFTRVADYLAGPISALDMAAAGGLAHKPVTAVRDADGNFKLIVWDLATANPNNVIISRLGEASAGAVSAVSVASARNFAGVITAVRDSDNKLRVIPWRISGNGLTVTRGTDAQADLVGTQIAVAATAQGVAAAVRDADNALRVITWAVSGSGNIGARNGTAIGGEVTEIDALVTPLAGSNLTTAVRSATGELMLIGWAIDADGGNLRRLGSSAAGAATKISAAGVQRAYPGNDPRDMVLTAVRDGDGNLKLITWDTNLINP